MIIYIYMLIKHFHIDHTYGVRLMGTREEGDAKQEDIL